MKSQKILVVAAAVFAGLLVVALSYDAVSSLSSKKAAFEAVDREVKLQEERFLRHLSSLPGEDGAVASHRAAYQSAETREARMKAFSELESAAQKTMLGKLDPQNPVSRRLSDELTGAINRRDIAVRSLEEAEADYNAAASGFRGGIARMFSSLPERLE